MLKDLKLLMVGMGAIGGVTAGLLKKDGFNIKSVCKYENLANLIQNEGIHVSGFRGDFKIAIPSVAKISELKESYDIIFLAVKVTDMFEVIEQLKSYMKEDTTIVAMENGITEDEIAKKVGKNRTVGCIVGWGGTLHEQGHVEMTSTGEFIIGTLDNEVTTRLKDLQTILSSVLPCEISTNFLGSRYSKLIINSCITSLGAICGLYLGEMLSIKNVRCLFLEIMKEAIAVSDALGLKVEVYGGKVNYYKLIAMNNPIGNWWRHTLLKIIGNKYKKLKSSSLQSLERGKPTEIDYLTGYITKNGKLHGIKTLINDKVVEIVKEIEVGKKSISPKNLDELYALL